MKKKQKIILGATSALTIVILILSLFFVIRSSTKKNQSFLKKITEKAKEPTDDKQQLVTQAKNLAQSYDYDQAIALLEKIVRTDLLKHNSFFKH